MQMSLLSIILTSALSFASMNVQAKASVPKEPLKPVVHTCKKTDSSIDALACNIYFESRGENVSGQMAIAFVTINRYKSSKYPDSIRKVVYQSKQFSWVNPQINYNIRDSESWEAAKKIASFVWSIKDMEILYKRLDPTRGSLYYHSKDVKPIWRHALTKTVTIGSHIFYKLKEKEIV